MPMWRVIDYQNRDMATRLVRRQMNIHMQQSGCTRQQKLLQVLLRSMHVSVHSHMPAEPLCSGEANHSAIVIYHISLVIFRLVVAIFHIQRDFELFQTLLNFKKFRIMMNSVRGFSDRILHTTSLLQVRSEAFRFGCVVSFLLPRKLQPDCKNNLPDPG